MKLNLPVTQNEVFLDPSKPVVSKTDIKGLITYANQSFLDISGFSRDELIGQSHNIVRHPDMPPEAFADLWDTVSQGLPWEGIVKNRAKNGDFYWVDAYVTPITENGKIVGYMSVRSTPKREQVAAAQNLYKAIREGRAAIPRTTVKQSLWHSVQLRTDLLLGIILLLLLTTAFLGANAGASPMLVGGLALLGMMLGIGNRQLWRHSLEQFMSTAMLAIQKMAEGKMNERVRKSEVPEFSKLLTDLESLRINLRAIIADIMYSTQTIDSVSTWLNKEINELLVRSDGQSQRAVQANQSMEAMNHSISDVSSNTDQTANAVASAEQIVESGRNEIDSSVSSSERVVQVVNNLRNDLSMLHQSIEQIGNISTIITEIAAQTNLLALNAAIEAARAGESGRGFAVVADEVRKLAERTTASAAEINSLVSTVKNATTTSVDSMAQVSSEVESGAEHIQASSRSFSNILAAIRHTVEMSRQNAAMLREQQASSAEVAGKIAEISELVEANMLSVRGVENVTINLMSRTAEEQRELVRHFEDSL